MRFVAAPTRTLRDPFGNTHFSDHDSTAHAIFSATFAIASPDTGACRYVPALDPSLYAFSSLPKHRGVGPLFIDGKSFLFIRYNRTTCTTVK
ncbi:MAG: hypothetical protein IT445_12115 [Phycisphaeraceae bacterium]|nr:hypothetical protein [Phycisphaeraceae bacterium]